MSVFMAFLQCHVDCPDQNELSFKMNHSGVIILQSISDTLQIEALALQESCSSFNVEMQFSKYTMCVSAEHEMMQLYSLCFNSPRASADQRSLTPPPPPALLRP